MYLSVTVSADPVVGRRPSMVCVTVTFTSIVLTNVKIFADISALTKLKNVMLLLDTNKQADRGRLRRGALDDFPWVDSKPRLTAAVRCVRTVPDCSVGSLLFVRMCMALLESRAYRGEMPVLVASSTMPRGNRVVRCGTCARWCVTLSHLSSRRLSAQPQRRLWFIFWTRFYALGCPEELESLTYRAFLEVLRGCEYEDLDDVVFDGGWKGFP